MCLKCPMEVQLKGIIIFSFLFIDGLASKLNLLNLPPCRLFSGIVCSIRVEIFFVKKCEKIAHISGILPESKLKL